MKKQALGPFLAVLFILAVRSCCAQDRRNSPRGYAARIFPAAVHLAGVAVRNLTGKAKGPALDPWRADADAALKRAPVSVMDKAIEPAEYPARMFPCQRWDATLARSCA
jgi:hypothetical protein